MFILAIFSLASETHDPVSNLKFWRAFSRVGSETRV